MNKYDIFDEAKREYVITRPDTPAPWINYLMGSDLCVLMSQTAGGLAFYKEPAEGRLTRYCFNGLPVAISGNRLPLMEKTRVAVLATLSHPAKRPAARKEKIR